MWLIQEKTIQNTTPTRTLIQAMMKSETLVNEIDKEEENPDKRKRYIAKVARMTDTTLASPRIDTVHRVCFSL